MTTKPTDKRFSPRQAAIISLVAMGASDKEIAIRLGISIPTAGPTSRGCTVTAGFVTAPRLSQR